MNFVLYGASSTMVFDFFCFRTPRYDLASASYPQICSCTILGIRSLKYIYVYIYVYIFNIKSVTSRIMY
jgi:hypothetical protein